MWRLNVLLYSFLIPKEFSLAVGVFNLSAYRVLLILLFPWVIWRLFNARGFRWSVCDTLAVVVCLF